VIPCLVKAPPSSLGKKDSLMKWLTTAANTYRGYPYLHEPEFTSRTWGMIERTFTCPIVFQVMEELKRKLNFH